MRKVLQFPETTSLVLSDGIKVYLIINWAKRILRSFSKTVLTIIIAAFSSEPSTYPVLSRPNHHRIPSHLPAFSLPFTAICRLIHHPMSPQSPPYPAHIIAPSSPNHRPILPQTPPIRAIVVILSRQNHRPILPQTPPIRVIVVILIRPNHRPILSQSPPYPVAIIVPYTSNHRPIPASITALSNPKHRPISPHSSSHPAQITTLSSLSHRPIPHQLLSCPIVPSQSPALFPPQLPPQPVLVIAFSCSNHWRYSRSSHNPSRTSLPKANVLPARFVTLAQTPWPFFIIGGGDISLYRDIINSHQINIYLYRNDISCLVRLRFIIKISSIIDYYQTFQYRRNDIIFSFRKWKKKSIYRTV